MTIVIIGGLYLCLIPVSALVVIIFPVMMVLRSKKERDQSNMHMFDEASEEMQRKQLDTKWMGSAIIVAAIYLTLALRSLVWPYIDDITDILKFLLITAIISVVVITVRHADIKKWLRKK